MAGEADSEKQIVLAMGALTLSASLILLAHGIFAESSPSLLGGILFLLLSGVPLGMVISKRCGSEVGFFFVYKRVFLKKEMARLAAAEALLAKRDFEAACAALEQVLKEEPDNLAANMVLAKALLAWKGAEGRAAACARLISQLERQKKPLPGSADAVLLLCDLLEESNLRSRALQILRAELAKGCCPADARRFNLRLALLEKSKGA